MALTIKEEQKKSRKKGGQGNKQRKAHLTGNKKKKSTPKEDMKIAYTPKTKAEKAAFMADLVRRLKSGEYEPNYRWGGGRTNVSDRH